MPTFGSLFSGIDEQRWLPPTGYAETIWYTDPDAARGLGSMTVWLASDERRLEVEQDQDPPR